MKATGFLLQDVTNPNTGEQTQRLTVRFDNGKVIRLFHGEDSIEDTVKAIKADRDAYLAKVVIS